MSRFPGREIASSRRAAQRRGALFVFFVAVLLAVFLLPTAVRADGRIPRIALHFVDFGINQQWKPLNSEIGNGTDPGQSSHILVAMPPDEQLDRMSSDQLRQTIRDSLQQQIDAALAAGNIQLEIRLVENINQWGYLPGYQAGAPHTNLPPPGQRNRQDLVMEFGAAAYGALSDVVQRLAPRADRISVNGTLGSNGTAMFARSVGAWRDIAQHIDQVTMTDGRAKATDVLSSISSLGASKLRIIVNHNDFAAPLDSIANLSVAQAVQKAHPDVTLLVATQEATGWNRLLGWNWFSNHISTMSHPDGSFHVVQKFADAPDKDLGTLTGRTIHPLLSADDRSARTAPLPTVGQSAGQRDTPNTPSLPQPPQGSRSAAPLGGIDLRVKTLLACGPLPQIRAVVVDPRTNAIVLAGSAQPSAGLDIHDLAMALWLVYGERQDAQFSLDPADPLHPDGKWLKAIYMPRILAGRSFGKWLYEADFLLKQYNLGITVDKIGKSEARKSIVPGYKSFAEMALEEETNPGSAQWSRDWFVIDRAEIKQAPGKAMTIEVGMSVRARRQVPDPLAPAGLKDVDTDPDGLEQRWARLFSAHLGEFGNETAFAHLFELAKAIALAKWLKQQNVPVDIELIRRLVNDDKTPTVDKVTALSAAWQRETSEPFDNGHGRGVRFARHVVHLFGGVDLTVDPKIVPDDGEARGIGDSIGRALRKGDIAAGTGFSISYGGEHLQAIALPLLMTQSPAAIASGRQ